MYLCLCNAITDGAARAQAKADCPTVATIYRSLGVKPKCGKCVPLMRQLLRQAIEPTEAQSVPAMVPAMASAMG
jgi:bacterioferritin-associated ferredoxin